jgi:hypothetical protein
LQLGPLQRGIYQALANSLDLVTLLGGVRVYDDAPQSAPYPFITLGQSVIRDWSTAAKSVPSIASPCMSGRAPAASRRCSRSSRRSGRPCKPLAPEGHYRVNLRHEFSEARLDPDGDTFHGVVRYHAVTEPAQEAAAAWTHFQ